MVVVIATTEEIDLVREFGYDDEKIRITGVGGVNVIRALKHLPKNTEILNIGYAGSNKIPVGTIVNVGHSRLYHENVDFDETIINLNEDGENYDCYTSTDFVTETNIEQPCVFDMELAFICAMFDNVKSIKVVSDNLSLKEYEKNVEKKDAD